MQKVQVTITVGEDKIRELIAKYGWKVVDENAFIKRLKSPEFATDLSQDILAGWDELNDFDNDGEGFIEMFGEEVLEFDEEGIDYDRSE